MSTNTNLHKDTCNEKIISIIEPIECPICFNNIEISDSFFTMTCCNKNVHIECLTIWYSSNSKHAICFMCNQKTDIYETLAINNSNLISLNDNDNNSENSSTVILNHQHNLVLYTIIHCLCCLFITGLVIYVFSIFIM